MKKLFLFLTAALLAFNVKAVEPITALQPCTVSVATSGSTIKVTAPVGATVVQYHVVIFSGSTATNFSGPSGSFTYAFAIGSAYTVTADVMLSDGSVIQNSISTQLTPAINGVTYVEQKMTLTATGVPVYCYAEYRHTYYATCSSCTHLYDNYYGPTKKNGR